MFLQRYAHYRLACLAACLTIVASGTCAQQAPVARIPPVSADTQDPILAPIYANIRKRGGQPSNMHRTLGNAPKIFKPYTDLAFALRGDSSVPRVYRELIILRATHLFRGDYEFGAHSSMAMSCGLTAEQVAAVKTWPAQQALFDERQRAVLGYADGMASPASVDEAAFAALAKYFSPQEIVELTITASYYVNAVLVTRALGVRVDGGAGQGTYGRC